LENFLLSANAVVPMFLLLAAGFLSQKAGVLTREDVPRFNKVAFRIFLPSLLFYNIYCSDLSAAVKPGLIIYAVCGVLLVFSAAFLSVRRLVPREDWKGVIAQGIFRSNFVIMGIPIAQALVGADQLGAVTVLIAVVVPLFNFLSVYVLERFRGGSVHYGQVLLEVAKNPLIVSSLLGIAFQLLGIRLPKLLEQTVSSLSVIASPLQLFLLGAFFRFDGVGSFRKELIAVCLGRLVIFPAAALTLAVLLGFRGVEFVALLALFASPTAVASFTMAQQMGGNAKLAGNIVVMTSLLCSLSFFCWSLLFKTLGVF
jgi:predicted permease